MRELLHHHIKFFIFCSLAAIGLRLAMVLKFPLIAGDSLVYGDIAKNWLQHGMYAISTAEGLQATYMRLPGYPSFLAVLFKIFGMEHYGPAMFIQIFIDLGTCFVVSALTLEIIRAQAFAIEDPSRAERPALFAFCLTAFCPFFITYVAAPLQCSTTSPRPGAGDKFAPAYTRTLRPGSARGECPLWELISETAGGASNGDR